VGAAVEEIMTDPFQRHYTLGELAKQWHLSRRTVASWFYDVEGVIRHGGGKLTKGRKQIHVSIRVPESVARQVYAAHTGRESSGLREVRKNVG
jgi:AraC-like DNA-binding protein